MFTYNVIIGTLRYLHPGLFSMATTHTHARAHTHIQRGHPASHAVWRNSMDPSNGKKL